MSDFRSYQHLYPSLEVYPRVQYFYERFSDLLVRFKRVTAVLPECFRDKRIESELEQVKSAFESGVEVIVIAEEDIDDTNLVGKAPTTPRESGNLQTHDGQRFKVAVCSIKPENLDEKRLKTINEVIDLAYPEHKPRLLILKCDAPEEGIETFKDFLRRYLKFEDILICSENIELKKHVSDLLESQITAGFVKISSILQQFESDYIDHYEITDEIINSKEVVNTFDDFLSELYSLRDIIIEAKGKNGDSVDCLLRHLCKVIKCAAIPSFARKYHLPLWVCNRILHEIQLEEALARCVHEDVLCYLREIEIKIKSLSHLPKKCRKRETIGKKLLPTMESTFAETEKKFSGMMHLGMVMKKMRFETDGYVKQTKLGFSLTQTESVPSKLGIDLRQALLSIDGVYGLGTIYGKLEIHLDLGLVKGHDTSSKHIDTNEKKVKDVDEKTCMSNSNTTSVTAEIKNVVRKSSSCTSYSHTTLDKTEITLQIENTLKKHRFIQPFAVKCVRESPKVMHGYVEPGDRIHSEIDKKRERKFGTIGGYVETSDKKLYGLTCYHVIGEDGKMYTLKENEYKHFGNYRNGMESNKAPFIDIAAVEVNQPLQKEYKEYLEKAMTRVSKVKLSFEETDKLIGRLVHKFGAVTGVTKGTVMAVDYNLFATKAHNYIIVIDSLAAENDLGEFSDVSSALSGASASNASAGPIDTQSMTNTCQKKPTYVHANKEMPEEDENANNCSSFTTYSRNNCNLDTAITFQSEQKFNNPEHKESTEQESTEQGKINKNLNLLVYVRDINTASKEEMFFGDKVFSKEGDSGAIICCTDPSMEGLSCLALSMLTAGEFSIEGYREHKTLSITLREGLSNIMKKCNLKF